MNPILKHSRQRDALLALMRSVTCHPSAEWLYSALKADFPKMSLATVYRNLGVLCECGDAIRLDVGDGTVHYDARTDNHSHFYCETCHHVSDIGGPELEDVDRALEQKYGVCIRSHSLIFHGLCRTCSQKENTQKNIAE